MAYCIGGEAAYYQPPEHHLCAHCDGQGVVAVAAYLTCNGETVHQDGLDGVEIPCPRCGGGGTEPEPDPTDNHRFPY